ncbi:MAG: hypothetical protein BWZ02_00877 [Lentisphaerae bacterium ADurb.BinA184]|nr:MAG: hypothetical protein BWZ02_00877 [Lentisphaerae bacterium ADurb.BinA184]
MGSPKSSARPTTPGFWVPLGVWAVTRGGVVSSVMGSPLTRTSSSVQPERCTEPSLVWPQRRYSVPRSAVSAGRSNCWKVQAVSAFALLRHRLVQVTPSVDQSMVA